MIEGFGSRMRGLREEKGLTRTELAALSKTCAESIYKAETGKQYPRLELCQNIAQALGTTVSGLIGEGIDGDVAELRAANHRLGLALARAEADLAEIGDCNYCQYWQNEHCIMPKDQAMGGSCFTWRGKGGTT